ncbi:MAG: anti-sigma factor antagonist [Nitrospirae bacterium]|nr:MAG: anti-sigma factor antagonist [Nitrospirota bacterium]
MSQQTKPGGVPATVIRLVGRLDSATSPQAEEAIAPVLAGGLDVVEFNLAELTYISSAGLRVLISTRKALAARKAQLYVTNPQPQIQKVFDIVKALPGQVIFVNTEELDAYLGAMQRKVTEGE